MFHLATSDPSTRLVLDMGRATASLKMASTDAIAFEPLPTLILALSCSSVCFAVYRMLYELQQSCV